ncbi:hypothetical protein TARUN_10483 [Trichoderma arundinaceum]|uniref:Uncharacterized protein n=1 Tax=Trichoderma arundinaceum TaxID=490622 RepID=A0A395N6W6_TRIAR|nr:hypothetical protein TARUN_10483 [Trichoderma arundinaceum]
MSSSSSSSYSSSSSTWQERLEGGRTAWSSQVTILGQTLAARYWYDGKNLNNAKEDAAECALNWLSSSSSGSHAQTWGTW